MPNNSQILMVADLYGDFRNELVLSVTDEDGKKFIVVAAATHATDHRYVAATEDRDYRLWLARNMGRGYRSIYDRVLVKPGRDYTFQTCPNHSVISTERSEWRNLSKQVGCDDSHHSCLFS